MLPLRRSHQLLSEFIGISEPLNDALEVVELPFQLTDPALLPQGLFTRRSNLLPPTDGGNEGLERETQADRHERSEDYRACEKDSHDA